MIASHIKLSFSDYSKTSCVLTHHDLARSPNKRTYVNLNAEFIIRVLPALHPGFSSSSPTRSPPSSKIEHGLAVLQTHFFNPRTGRDSYSKGTKVYVKWGFTEKRVASLQREASFYMNELKQLQGDVVPMCYGFYTDKRKHAKIGCLVLQYCDKVLAEGLDEFEMFRLIMVKSCQLHNAGIQHNMLDISKNISAADGDIRFLDFSTAQVHKCPGAYPEVGGKNARKRPHCKELMAMENLYGLLSGVTANVYSLHSRY